MSGKNKMKHDMNSIDLMIKVIQQGDIDAARALINQGIDIHYELDYFLYVAAFAKQKQMQEFFIDLGLDPEITKARLEYDHPDELDYLRELKIKKEIKDAANHLDRQLTQKDSIKTKIKL